MTATDTVDVTIVTATTTTTTTNTTTNTTTTTTTTTNGLDTRTIVPGNSYMDAVTATSALNIDVYCCNAHCFVVPRDQVDGRACYNCLRYGWCACACVNMPVRRYSVIAHSDRHRHRFLRELGGAATGQHCGGSFRLRATSSNNLAVYSLLEDFEFHRQLEQPTMQQRQKSTRSQSVELAPQRVDRQHTYSRDFHGCVDAEERMLLRRWSRVFDLSRKPDNE